MNAVTQTVILVMRQLVFITLFLEVYDYFFYFMIACGDLMT